MDKTRPVFCIFDAFHAPIGSRPICPSTARRRYRAAQRVFRGALLLLLLTGLRGAFAETQNPVQVEIKGLAEELQSNVMAALSLVQEKTDANFSESRIKLDHVKAVAEIRSALQPYGYYRPTVVPTLTRDGSGWKAVYRIETGPPLKLASVNIGLTGDTSATPILQKLVRDFPLKPGDTLLHQAYENSKKNLQSTALELGYFDARYARHEIKIDLDDYLADIDLQLESGPRYRFGRVQFDNQTTLSPALLKWYVHFKQGEPFNNRALLKLQQNLAESGYFGRAEVEPLLDHAKNGEVPIRVTVTPRAQNRYQAGLGYGTDTGPRVTLGYEDRLVNRRGHRLRTNLRVSAIKQVLEASYIIPLRNPARDQLSITTAISAEDTKAGQAQTGRIGVRYSGARWDWRETISLDYLFENYHINKVDRTGRMLIPGVNWSYIHTDNDLFPRHGHRVDLGLSGAYKDGIISDNSFFQARFGAKWINAIGHNGRIILRGQFGFTESSDFNRLPLTLRFFTGGDNSVRGYDYNGIGPRDRKGRRAGGRYLAVGSFEYEHMIWGDWGAAVFYDVGNAFNDFDTALKQGAGLGVRWRSPVGLVRVDVASAVSEPNFPVHFHLVLGTDF